MIIAFANHKGGTGKTTSVINIGRALAKAGYKVLLVDLDPQGNLSYSLGLSDLIYTTADFMQGNTGFENIACEASGMHIIPATTTLYEQQEQLNSHPGKHLLLKNNLSSIKDNYDFILLDCPPSISVFSINALNAADGVIIPMVFEILSIQGLDQMLQEINKIKLSTNRSLKIIGVLGVIVNENRKLSEEVLGFIRDNYRVNIFNNHVRNNVKAAEAPSFGESVIDYAPGSISARDYTNVTNELLKILETKPQYI